MARFLLAVLLAWVSPASGADAGIEYFEKHIRPVLAAKCYACHSEKAAQAMGGLRVDSREALRKGGNSGAAAIVPGKPEESLLIQALRHAAKDIKMPPGQPLEAEEVSRFVEWVKMGAPDPREAAAAAVERPAYDWEKEKRHWAYQPVQKVAPPAVKDPEWSTTPIDRFLRAKLEEKGLRPAAKAGKAALLRRVSYNLTGLPPSPSEVDAFLADTSASALEKVVDRLLASPAYGEQWGRHWLDVVRYADTGGDASDFPVPEMYRYRNYVIRSIQQDKPYDLFVREQIAGDTLGFRDDEDRRDKIIAAGYLANARRFGQTTREFHLTIDDAIENMGRAILGLTTGCARCHDHKFDPIPTRDYYALAGILQSSNFAHAGLEHHQYLDGFRALNAKDDQRLAKLQKQFVDNYRVVKSGKGKDSKDTEEKLKYLEAATALDGIRRSWPDIPMAYSVGEGKPVNARIQVKGEPNVLGPEVERGFLSILGGQRLPAGHEGSGRRELAGWLTDAGNPLTARVMVNRVWMWHFGRGLVNTPNDLGTRGDKPTHPELLDYLAARFVEGGWSVKKLHKEIVLTRAYAAASVHDAANATKDPNNEYYWQFQRRRLTAEEQRDALLLVSGELDRTPGGAHPFPPRSGYTFTQHRPFVADLDQYDTNKRSVYLLQQRIRRHPYLELFDGPDTNASTPVRQANSTAVQALYFMNNDFFHARASALAGRAVWAGTATESRLRFAYRHLFGRAPLPAEIAQASAYLQAARAAAGPGTAPEEASRQAWNGLMRALLASNEFLYVD